MPTRTPIVSRLRKRNLLRCAASTCTQSFSVRPRSRRLGPCLSTLYSLLWQQQGERHLSSTNAKLRNRIGTNTLCEGDKPYFALLKTVRSAEDKYLITVFGLQVMQFNVTAPETGRTCALALFDKWPAREIGSIPFVLKQENQFSSFSSPTSLC